MASKTPSPALAALVTQRYPIEAEIWADFWGRLAAKELHPGEAVAVLSSLTTRMPDGPSVSALLGSLRANNPQPDPPARRTVNIVGTGGGPSTFNLSTASAFVAAAMGTRIIKTGSRAYASRTGSVDLLDRLGIRMASSYEQLDGLLDEFGIACAGPFVYPKELRLLARQVLPFDMKTIGRFFNLVGPFLAAVPVSVQVTGVSDHSVLPVFRALATEDPTRDYWLCWNGLGCDELLSVTEGHVFDTAAGEERVISPTELGLTDRPFDDLLPVTDLDDTAPHFLKLIGGDGPVGAIESIRLNAAVLAINGGVADDWPAALKLAAETMESGEPARLIERLRAHGEASAA
ncbi:MAG: anthranilate phosphoribosyltransferase [Solirubrobacteraceae bacterium]|jgi:anthranilate phosphoribosyltransferase|nr:anthranilate phosphoribosyltransferase [Solirubrobacteraceae bacterium]